MPDSYTVLLATPSVETYCRLRSAAGMRPKTLEAATRGLPATLFAVQVMQGDLAVGMGRVVGDGGCFYQVTDMAVLPEHQGRGLGKLIMRHIMDYLRANALPSAYVSLIADGPARELYAQFGFAETAPASVGMAWRPMTQG